MKLNVSLLQIHFMDMQAFNSLNMFDNVVEQHAALEWCQRRPTRHDILLLAKLSNRIGFKQILGKDGTDPVTEPAKAMIFV